MIADVHFLRPWWLLALLAAPLLVRLIGRRTDIRSRWEGMIAPHLLGHLLIDRGGSHRFRPVHLTAALIAVAAIAAAGPTWERERPPFVEDTAPLAIAIDLTATMNATDVSPTRLERAKLKVRDILDLRRGARTALFAYAGSAHMVLPLTDDAALVRTYIAALSPGIMPVEGKDTAKALQAVEAGLANETVPGTILFLTDGVERKAFPAFEQYKGRNDLMVLGIGTAEGGPVKTADGGYLTDASGARVHARLDIDALKALQNGSRVQVATATPDDSDVRWIARRIQSAFAQKVAEGQTRWRDAGWWLTIPIALFAALWFRRGWTVRWAGFLLVAGMALAGGKADAADFSDLWFTPDQQGRRAFERGDFQDAAEHFADPAWRGVALYRAGRFQDAIDAFAQKDTAESYYNQGNALMHLDKPKEAVAAYGQALKLRRDWAEAKANLALAEKRNKAKEKQEEEEQQEQGADLPPDQVQIDEKGEKGKEGTVQAGEQTADMWMRNIQVSPADLLARKFAIEAREDVP
ncbi:MULTISPECIES: VWA domain-containing protein [unclassified Sinorhizobium]|uniref:vWA domain-containing protein n=1 Tax=unclassified Sinorhizobium TaxID=2613772 RepID=UPI0024C3BE89|nr:MULTISPECIES: VWA domain-containing protein [unclassified Sinorhizobium]MDK1377890.1 VWA domain-containing protein [Sinorhizobium sp. 6-70]MDK1481439.1 VWA domain-containing protein [Sinorhizobium sp. 6-117]